MTSGPWPFGKNWARYVVPTDASVAAAMCLCDAAKAAAAAWAAWREAALPAVRTPNAFVVIIEAPSSRLEAPPNVKIAIRG